MPLKIYCRNCVQYRDEWCKVISDSPDPDLMRDCGFYRDKTLFNLDKVKVNKGMKEVNGYNPSKDPRLINCKTECGNERCFAKRYGLFAERTCPNFVEPKLQTNADRIRAMTDEELAEWLDDICKSAYDEGYTKETDEPLISPYPSTASEWLDWLREEVDHVD